MTILGFNAYHGDASAAIIPDGQPLAAVEEERFRRIKHWAGLPSLSMRYCLDNAGLRFEDLEHIAINLDPKVNNLRRLLFILRTRPNLKLIVERLQKRGQTKSVKQAIADAFPGQRMKASVHHLAHLAHLASSYLCSPFEDAINVSIDGMGDFASAAWGPGINGKIHIEDRVYFPHSLGIFYSSLTMWLGFPHYGDEYKVMGLAPYGELKYLDVMRQIVLLRPDGTFRLNLDCFLHHKQSVSYTWDNGSPDVGTMFAPGLETLLGPARKKDEPLTQHHRDIARSIQAMYEEAFFHLPNTLHKKHGGDNLTLSGGCAMNSVANGKVRRHTASKNVYIQPASGDAVGAIGAALIVHQQLSKGSADTPVSPIPTVAIANSLSISHLHPHLSSPAPKVARASSLPCPVERVAGSPPPPISHLPSLISHLRCTRTPRPLPHGPRLLGPRLIRHRNRGLTRQRGAAVPASLVFTLLVKATLWDGWRGWYYALQRVLAEMFLALKLIERKVSHE